MKFTSALWITCAAAAALASPYKSLAQSRIVTFEQYTAGQNFPPNSNVNADAYPNSNHYLIDDADLPGTPTASVSDIGGLQSHVLTLEGGARLSFTPQIGVTAGTFDLNPGASPSFAQFSYLALDAHLYELDDILASPTGILQTGQSRWSYAVTSLSTGYSRIVVNRNPLNFAAIQSPQFAIIGGTLPIAIDNVNVSVFPEPTSLVLAAPALLLLRRRRGIRPALRA